MKNIVLIGFMGSGKSTVGQALAKDLNLSFFDLDKEIIKREKRSVASIFKEEGEAAFRSLETDIVKDISAKRGVVIATGGGVILNGENIIRLKENGVLIYLKADLKILIDRATRSSDRPLLQGDNLSKQARDLLTQREPMYEAAADIVIDTSYLSLKEVVLKIKETL